MTADQSARPGVKSVVFYSFNADDALASIRMLGPAKLAGLEVIQGVNNRVVDPQAVSKGQLVILQREFSVDYYNYEKVISQARAQHKPVILDLDDLILALPENHPDRVAGNFAPALLPLLQSIIEADLVTVPTARLRENLLTYNAAIEIIPNYLDDSLWQLKSPSVKADPAEPLVIGYMGGHSHAPDLLSIQPALLRLVDKYSERIRFQFWGIDPPPSLVPHSRVDWYPIPSSRYSDFVVYFQQQQMDIAIAPLGDNLFNSCKSAIKFFDYTALGAPGVYSRVAPYTEVIEHGKEGFLASTPDEWVDCLSRLIENPDLRKELVENAQRQIKQNWLLSKNLTNRLDVYSQLASTYQPRQKVYPDSFQMLKTITRQVYEEHVRSYDQKQMVQYLNKRAEEQDQAVLSLGNKVSEQEGIIQTKNQHLSDLEDEVLSYATSSSWKLTRPLRKILRKW